MEQRTVRIDMALIDRVVLSYIESADDKRIRLVVIANEIGCSPMTVKRSIQRLKSAGRLTWIYTEQHVCEFTVKDNPS